MNETPEVRPVDRHEWERIIRRARLGGVITGNAKGSRGGVSGATFKAVAFIWASHGNPDGTEIYPGDATLAVESEVGLKAVKAVKAALIRLGLTVRTKAGARRLGQGDTYRLTLPVSPSLGELVEVLSPEGLRLAAVETYEKQRGTPKGSYGPPTILVVDPPVQGPQDPRQEVEQGPVDPREEERSNRQRGSAGPPNEGCRGSGGTVVGGPEDRDTKPLPNPKELSSTSEPPPATDTDTDTDTDTVPAAKPKRERRPEPDRTDVDRICQHLADRIVANGSKRPTINQEWRREARLLLDEKRDPPTTIDKVIALIDWCQSDPFWRSNVRSMPKFRAQYDALRLKALAEYDAAKKRGNTNGHPTAPVNGARNGPIPADERCPKPGHRGQRKSSCSVCRSDNLATRTPRRTA